MTEEATLNREIQLRTWREKQKRIRKAQRFHADETAKQPTERQVLAEIRRISMGDVLCSQERYNFAKPVNYPNADKVCELIGLSWEEIAAWLGLRVWVRTNG